jgi:hypothetical protein
MGDVTASQTHTVMKSICPFQMEPALRTLLPCKNVKRQHFCFNQSFVQSPTSPEPEVDNVEQQMETDETIVCF